MQAEGDLDEEELEAVVLILLVDTPERIIYPNMRMNLNELSDANCISMFRFAKESIYLLTIEFGLPETIIVKERYRTTCLEALLILLRRMAYPNRLASLCGEFGRSESAISTIFLHMVELLADRFKDKIYFDRNAIPLVQQFSQAIHDQGSPLQTCWGFIDGTIRPCCRPVRHQRIVYNGHKRVHSLKFQSITAPNGMIVSMFGPVEGRRHDVALLQESNIMQLLQNTPQLQGYILYGDPAYAVNGYFISPFRGAALTEEQQEFNRQMSSVRVSVEWMFGAIVKKGIKVNNQTTKRKRKKK